MGSIIKRGTRTNPRYYLQFKLGTKPDGSPKLVMRATAANTMELAKKRLAEIETAIDRGEEWDHKNQVVTDVGELLAEFAAGLKNRAAYEDRLIVQKGLIPVFKGKGVKELTLAVVMRWLDQLSSSDMASQTQRHRLNLLSRFFGWAIERGITDMNPCRMIPRGKRPSAQRERDIPWLEDASKVPALMAGLGPSLGLVYYLARFAGLREGEAAGLRMSDLEWLAEGTIRVRFSFNGPLKEDKAGSKPVKWVPAPMDAVDVLQLHLKRRKLQGAKAEDVVFPYERPTLGRPGKVRKGEWAEWAGWHPKQIRTTWRKVANGLGLPKELTFYGASRHTYVTTALLAGASLDQVAEAVGHASPEVTKRAYYHVVRKQFAPVLRQGLSQ